MISFFTPCHQRYVGFARDAYQSLEKQTDPDWEWVILANGGATPWDFPFPDKRVKVHHSDEPGIGALKAKATSLCSGEIVAELDADDMLHESAVSEIKAAFLDPQIHFAYSNTVEFHDKTWEPHFYSPYWGWTNRPVQIMGRQLVESIAFPPTAHSIRRIEWAPNHIRCWRKESYQQLGGHDSGLSGGDDHDLVCRTYLAHGQRGMFHIDKPLYLQRVHDSSQKSMMPAIQQQVYRNYLKYIGPMVERWADDNGLRKLDLGGGINPKYGFESVDIAGNPNVLMDLDQPWDSIEDNSIGVLRAYHVVEHLDDVAHFFTQAHRKLAPGGWLLVEVPSVIGFVDGKEIIGLGAFRDPTHKQFMSYQNFWYFTRSQYRRFVPGYPNVPAFQESRIETWMMEEHCPVVTAELICLKDGFRAPGEVLV